jgi:peptidoglycan/xylan/chitin deacetylase (PgdA/CDA1 family)
MFMNRNIIKILIVLSTVAFIFVGLKLLNKLSMSLKFQSFGELINQVNTKDKVVALTYDDGPNPPYTNQLIEILERYQIKATFFVVGKAVEQHPDTVRLILAKGHELGNHSYSHKALISEKPGFIWSEIQKTDQLLRQLGVKDEIHFRAPYGRKLFVLPYFLAKLHKKNILWTIDSKDYEASNPEMIETCVLEQVRPGSIILMHDGGGERSHTVVATERLIENLKQKGYSFQTVSNLLSKRPFIK